MQGLAEKLKTNLETGLGQVDFEDRKEAFGDNVKE